MKRLPHGAAQLLVPLLVTGIMTCIVSGIATARALGLSCVAWRAWGESWLVSWGIAFPLMTVLLPLVRRAVERMVEARPDT